MLAVARSDIGLTRQTNEDGYDCEIPNLYIIADGMGGHAAGEVASQTAIRKIKQFFQFNFSKFTDYEKLLEAAILAANEEIFYLAKSNALYKGMGTTASIIYFHSDRYFWAHVGDSRIYRYHNNQLQQITKDHSLVQDLWEQGNISKEEVIRHPLKNMLTRAVGVGLNLAVDTGTGECSKGNSILLTTDGLTNMVSDEELAGILIKHSADVDQSAESMIAAALKAGGEDNVTLVLIQYGT